MIDNLPAVLNKTDINNNYTYEVGFPIGYVLVKIYYFNEMINLFFIFRMETTILIII